MRYFVSLIIFCFFLIAVSCNKNGTHNEHDAYTSHQHNAHPSLDTPKTTSHEDQSMRGHDMGNMNEDPASEEEVLEVDTMLLLKANVHTAIAEVKNIYEGTRFLGTVSTDEKKTEVISARVQGRVDKLFFKAPGSEVHKGDPLFGIYSEQLYSDMNDYLVALKQKDSVPDNSFADQLIESAKQRLILAGITEKEIATIKNTRKIPPMIIYYSPVSGFISELMIREGQYVETGMAVFKVSDLNTVWVETQVYPDEVNLVNQSAAVNVEFDVFPEKVYKGAIVFSNPTLEENRKINLVRIKIDNKDHLIKPGMMAYVNIVKSTKKVLVIPKSALLIQDMMMVWVEKKEGTYVRRMVSIGTENKRDVEILSGVNEGEKVVTTGSYLLNSEYILRQGANSMAGMKM